MKSRVESASRRVPWFATALFGALLLPFAASSPVAPALEAAIPGGADPSEPADGAPGAQDVTVECKVTFKSGSYGACRARWYQTGRMTYTWHQRFHNIYVTNGYSVMSWTDSRGSFVFIEECYHTVSTLEFALARCSDSRWDTYAGGWQELFIYGSKGSCSLGDCILHGRFIIT